MFHRHRTIVITGLLMLLALSASAQQRGIKGVEQAADQLLALVLEDAPAAKPEAIEKTPEGDRVVQKPVLAVETPPARSEETPRTAAASASRAAQYRSLYGRKYGLPLTRELDLGRGVRLRLVLIPPGEFTMGSNDGENYEKLPHKVRITKPFYMGGTEVTQAQYEAVMGHNPSNFKGRDNPIETVSWNDATEFCRKLSQKSRIQVGLPTEAEWEYACRAGSTTNYCFGDSDNQMGDYAWSRSNSGRKTHPVGQKKPNAWGLYDMYGNVWEWCQDWYDGGYYAKNHEGDPSGPQTGSDRVQRGGSWPDRASYCRVAGRAKLTPKFTGYNHGFRVVVSARTP